MSLFAAAALSLSVSGGSVAAGHTSLATGSAVATAPDDATVPTVPPVSDFYPEESNLTDCVGLVEKPGCGSEQRGGWRQTAVLVMILSGLAVVFGNVIRGVRKNRAGLEPSRQPESID